MKTHQPTSIITSIMFLAVAVGHADTVVYQNNFENGAGSAWSNTSIASAAGGRHFLGQFGTIDTAIGYGSPLQLNLQNLALHSTIELSFDLFITGSWDGNGDGEYHAGPDIWLLREGSQNTLIRTTFTTMGSSFGYHQAYPNTCVGGYTYDSPDANLYANPQNTGASEVNTLGYGLDAVYHIDVLFNHTSNDLQLSFFTDGHGCQSVWDEGWGLDNVTLRPSLIPEPTSLCLVTAALGLLAAEKGRRGRITPSKKEFR